MVEFRDVEFREGEFWVRTLRGTQLAQSYRLRHKVFAEKLKWVPPSSDHVEVDMYDLWGATVGLLHENGTLLAMARLLPASGQFMLENEFRVLLPSGYTMRKEPDTAEITRLAIDPDIQDPRLSTRMMLAVLKGIYQWAVENRIRYYYLEVEHRFLRALRMLGFPCEPVGPPVVLPPAGAGAVAALYDMVRFDEENVQRRPDFLRWISTIETKDGKVMPGRTSTFGQISKLNPVATSEISNASGLVKPGSVVA